MERGQSPRETWRERWAERPRDQSYWQERAPDGRRLLRVRRGDSLVFVVQAVLPNLAQLLAPVVTHHLRAPAVPTDITGWTVYFTAKYQLPDVDAASVAQANSAGTNPFPAGTTVTLVNATAGYAAVQVPPTWTQFFPDSDVRIVFDVKGVNPMGGTFTLDWGDIVVEPSVTRAV